MSATPTFAAEIKNLSVICPGKFPFGNLPGCEKKILDRINLNLEKGVFYSLIGANGAGKSTLLKALCGLRSFSGSVKIFGRDLKKVKRNIIGYSPQNDASDKNCPVSVYEAVSVGRFAKNGIFRKFLQEDANAVQKALALTGIENIKNMPIGAISGGEARKTSLARVIAQQPEIVLFDEPQANLDPQSKQDFMSLIKVLYKKFAFTCLMATHDIDLIPDCCSKVIMLKNSKIVLETDNENIAKKAKEYNIYS
ncbi:MAG: metal ABC transporter ATP-binding protein [Endomicrobium sp.]|jgi:ABC-type Mn2+/Zn2+ transport system ATPase subunit|nr:metal ABC transporter ATP-binding protein [Endomicrobium sp.]